VFFVSMVNIPWVKGWRLLISGTMCCIFYLKEGVIERVGKLNRKDIVLAALAPAQGDVHTPVQVQKLLFLIDREIPNLVDGPHFNFQPYHYGPFDISVYEELQNLACQNLVASIPDYNWSDYRLTKEGQKSAEELLISLPPKAQEFIRKASEFVRSLSFPELVSAIYKAYPDTKVNSVFQECR
jgi:hypothetical protein